MSRKVDIPFSTASRILKALEDAYFLERSPSDKLYRLGKNCYVLGVLARETGLLRRVSLPVMEALRTQFEETVILYVREGNKRLYYEQLEGPRNLKRLERVGETAPLWVGSAGRCLLAWTSEAELSYILKDVRELTPNTITDSEVIVQMIREIRETGYSISVSEREEGVCSVSSPVVDFPRRVAACLTVTGPAIRFTDDILKDMIPALKEAAQTISNKLKGS